MKKQDYFKKRNQEKQQNWLLFLVLFLFVTSFTIVQAQHEAIQFPKEIPFSGKSLEPNIGNLANFSLPTSDDSLIASADGESNAVNNDISRDRLKYKISLDNSTDVYENSVVVDWWAEIKREVNEMLLHVKQCPDYKHKCFSNESAKDSFQTSECECDSSCNDYGECCLDLAAATSQSPKFQNIQDKMFCGLLSKSEIAMNSKSIFMIGKCNESKKGSLEDDFCNQKVPLDSYKVILDIPVISLRTNYTYRNYYCALCNDDSENLLNVNMTVKCNPKLEPTDNFTKENFLYNTKYIPGERRYHVPEETTNKNNGDNSSVSFLPVTESVKRKCIIQIDQYKSISNFVPRENSRVCFPPELNCFNKEILSDECAKQIRNCHPSWPVSSDFRKCSSYSLKIYDPIEKILYKNPHCAKCNFANVTSEQFNCTSFKENRFQVRVFSQGPPFSVLFKIQTWPPRRCEDEHNIWSPFTNKCSPIVCGNGRILKGGKCVEIEIINKSNLTLQNSCLRVPLENFTLYKNKSVYSSVNNKLYTQENYELYNDSFILVCVEDANYYKNFSPLHYYTTVIVLGISLACLAFHIILYFCFSRMRTWHGKNLLCLCCSLFIAQFLFLTGIGATNNFGFCVFMSVCLHYFWLASFFWMNVLSIDVWRTFRARVSLSSENKKKLFLYYSLYSWGISFVIVATGLVFDLASSSRFKPIYAGTEVPTLCWINSKLGLLSFFLIPVGIIIIVNFILFIITSYKIYLQSKETRFVQNKSQSVRQVQSNEQDQQKEERKMKDKQNKIRFSLYLKLGILQGLTWLSGFLASFANSSVCWYIFTVLNGLQGAVIVICFDMKKWVLNAIWEYISTGPLSKITKSSKSSYPCISEINKKEEIHESENENEDPQISQPPKPKRETKILKGQYSLNSLNFPRKLSKEFVAPKFSLGSALGNKKSHNNQNDSELNSFDTSTGTTQTTEISEFLTTDIDKEVDVIVEKQKSNENQETTE